MASLSTPHYHNLKNHDFEYSDMEVDGLQNGGSRSPSADQGRHSTGTAIDFRSGFRPASSDDDFMLGPVISASGDHGSTTQLTAISNATSRGVGSIDQFARASNNTTPVPAGAFTRASYPTIAATDVYTMAPQDMDTLSPLQTNFDYSQASHGSSRGMYGESEPYSALSAHSAFSDAMDGDFPSRKRRSSGYAADYNPPEHSPKPKGRRKSVTTEPGSARAVYLEKNRKAASKCRTKQKKQQEELVETARDVERKNKLLKAEVEYLKDDMRSLMDMVGRHSRCSDNRLQLYVQREADRLVAGSRRGSSVDQTSPKSSTSSPG